MDCVGVGLSLDGWRLSVTFPALWLMPSGLRGKPLGSRRKAGSTYSRQTSPILPALKVMKGNRASLELDSKQLGAIHLETDDDAFALGEAEIGISVPGHGRPELIPTDRVAIIKRPARKGLVVD